MNELYCNKLVSSYEGTHPKNLLVIIHRLMSERQLFTFKIASNGSLH